MHRTFTEGSATEIGTRVRVLNISLDPSYLEGSDSIPGNTLQRTAYYAQVVESYDIVVYSPKGTGAPRTDIGENVRVHPARAAHRWMFPISAYRLGVQVCHEFKPDLIHTQDIFGAGLVGYLLKKRFDLPVCFAFHGDTLGNPDWIHERRINRLYNLLGRWLLKRGDAYRVVSTSEKRKLIGYGVPEEKIWHIGPLNDLRNFLDADGRPVRNHLLGQRGFSKVVVFAGRLVDQKDLPTLLRAMALVTESVPYKVALVIAGDGQRRSSLMALANDLGLRDNVVFTGRLEYDQVPKYVAAADVFALSSIYEGSAKVLAEASACCLPVVATDISGTRDTVIDGETGIVVPPRDPEAFAQALINILDNPQRAREMGLAGRKRVVRQYTPDYLLPSFRDMWETTVRRHLEVSGRRADS